MSKMAYLNSRNGVVVNLFVDGTVQLQTPSGASLTMTASTAYPREGRVSVRLGLEQAEQFEILIRNPAWSETTTVQVNGIPQTVKAGYICLERLWQDGDIVEIELDMRTRVLLPTAYGSQVLMNTIIWQEDVVIPTYDEEDPMAKYHVALQRGPIILAQENRLGYSVDDPVSIASENGYVSAVFPEKEVAPYENILELAIPLTDGSFMHVTDYASAGKLWCEASKMAAWMLTE